VDIKECTDISLANPAGLLSSNVYELDGNMPHILVNPFTFICTACSDCTLETFEFSSSSTTIVPPSNMVATPEAVGG